MPMPMLMPDLAVKQVEEGDGGRMVAADCRDVPALVSSFVDTLVDFAVGGQVVGVSGGEEEGIVLQHVAADRVVAIGDVHGDLGKAKSALQLAQVMGEKEEWVGGKTVVVQVGDLLDRGSEELRIMYLLEKLKKQAQRAGGDVHIINGNHEIMNMEGNFTFASAGGMEEFRNWSRWYRIGNALKSLCEGIPRSKDVFAGIPANLPEAARARLAALRPGGAISSRFLAQHPTVLMVGGTVFVHGGVLPGHASYGLDRINAEVKEWIQGKNGWLAPNQLHGRRAIVWARHFSHEEERHCDCEMLSSSLGLIPGASRMVVGHTIQESGINFACDGRVLRVDVGMSQGCRDGLPQVLEIVRDRSLFVRSLVSKPKRAKWERKHQERPGLASLVT